MADLFDQIKESYKNDNVRSTEVPEFGGITVYGRPLTPHKLNQIEVYAKNNGGTLSARFAKTLQVVLEDEEGKLIFGTPSKLQWLSERVNANLLARIMNELGLAEDDEDPIEAAVKN